MSRIAVWIHGGIGGGFFSQGQPAIQQLIFRLANHFEIDVYTQLPPNKDFIAGSFNLFYPDRRIKWGFIRWMYLGLKFFLVSIRKPYHLVYGFWGYPAGFIAVLLGKIYNMPSVVHLQGGDAVHIPDLKYGVFNNPVRARMCRWAYSKSSCLIALSRFQEEMLRKNRVLRKISIIPFGVDTQKFNYKAERLDHPLLRFLHVGNHTPIKGQEVMLKTFSLVARSVPSHLVIIGPDFFQGQLTAWCKSLGIEDMVEFLGPQPHNRLPGFYHTSDILLHTPFYEGQGLVFAEAAACGTVIAGTCVGMLSDMGDDCGLIVQPGEAKILSDKILTALQLPEQLKRMQRSARQWAEEKDILYTERNIAEKLNELFPNTNAKKYQEFSGQSEG